MKKLWEFLRELFCPDTSLRGRGYPSLEELRASGIAPHDFYLFIRFGVPLPPRNYGAHSPQMTGEPGDPPKVGSSAVKPKEAA